MPLCNGLAEGMRQRVQHAVVRMHRGQTILVKLISHNAHQLFHSLIIISPVTDNLREETQLE